MTGTGTPAARASAMRRASVRIRDRRSPSSSSVNRYDFGTRTLSTAGRPRNSVRQSSASAPRLISTLARCGPATKTFHRRPPIGGGDGSTGRLEESRGLGGRPFAPSGCEIRWEAPRVSRFQDAPFEQHDGGPVPLAPDGPAGGLKEPVDGGIDDRIIVALREPELPGVVISEGLPFHARRAQRKTAATFPGTAAAMPPISRAIASCISLPRFTKRVVTLGETRSNRFSRGNGDAYVRSTRRRAAIPRRSAYISAGKRVPDIRMLAWTPSNTDRLRTLGSSRRKANFPSGPGTPSRRLPSS